MADRKVAVQLTGLRKRFGDLEVLKGVSLTAHSGDVIAIIGGSGSGKSTLLRCINFLETPTAGEVRLHGELVAMKPDGEGGFRAADPAQLNRLRARLGMVFQSFNLWPHRTVLENVIEAPVHVLGQNRDAAIANAERLLDRVGLLAKRDVYPEMLSGGQKQRAAIARALAVDPHAMLFDEPTSALDPELVGEVLSVIADLAREGRTMILVTHEMQFARNVASEIIFLRNGLIEEQGKPSDVFDNPKSEALRAFLAPKY
ncbi:ATP-binding cassette domain-containing protein [Xinfangfangia sp. CPCC 101601]|uniref:ATP-binding cassette domain-containing protein n=1 Tax=Pseudogemmobacter lacusdianii TaxID=3069608 RepID=A0ABU0W156_9RHOB|nr:ATP-binding cassette domain-containing protein [Xinfangfangia sp. CPCC 101601]MDQ2067749.1 ATP-binding cassette domain-containing protein [Xinfangfangia sp. CPCC 101601]